MVYAEHLLSSGNLEFWHMPGRGHLHTWLPINTLNTRAQVSCLVDISHVLSQLTAVGIKHILCDSTGRGPRSSRGRPWTVSVHGLPLLICFVSFHRDKSRPGVNHVLSSVSPPSKQLALGWLGDTQQTPIILFHSNFLAFTALPKLLNYTCFSLGCKLHEVNHMYCNHYIPHKYQQN